MNWYVCKKPNGDFELIEKGLNVPNDYEIQVETVNQDYLLNLSKYTPNWISAEEFMKRIPDVELEALLEASRTDVEIAKAILEAQTSEHGVDINHPETIANVDYLLFLNIISEDTRNSLLS